MASCAARSNQLSVLPGADRQRFAACRPAVIEHLCPDRPDCGDRALELYARELPEQRARWLADYGCPAELLERARPAPAGRR